MEEIDALLAEQPIAEPTLTGAEGKPAKCRRHIWVRDYPVPNGDLVTCMICGKPKDEARSRRGKNSRDYGNRAELKVAKLYGGEKIGHAGGPVDVRGKDFATQVKTHRRLPPREWVKSFAAMSQDARVPRMLLRFVGSAGTPPKDYFVFEAKAFLDWFGRDE